MIEFYFTAEDETKTYFDMNFLLGGNAWGGLVTAATSHTTALTLNGESVATQPEQGSTISYLGDYTVEIVRIGSTLTVTQTLVTTDGDVYQAVDVFEGITTEALTGLIVGNPYFCDNIAAYYCAIV